MNEFLQSLYVEATLRESKTWMARAFTQIT